MKLNELSPAAGSVRDANQVAVVRGKAPEEVQA